MLGRHRVFILHAHLFSSPGTGTRSCCALPGTDGRDHAGPISGLRCAAVGVQRRDRPRAPVGELPAHGDDLPADQQTQRRAGCLRATGRSVSRMSTSARAGGDGGPYPLVELGVVQATFGERSCTHWTTASRSRSEARVAEPGPNFADERLCPATPADLTRSASLPPSPPEDLTLGTSAAPGTPGTQSPRRSPEWQPFRPIQRSRRI